MKKVAGFDDSLKSAGQQTLASVDVPASGGLTWHRLAPDDQLTGMLERQALSHDLHRTV